MTDAELDDLEGSAFQCIAVGDRGPFEEVIALIAEVRRLRLVETCIIRLRLAERVAEAVDKLALWDGPGGHSYWDDSKPPKSLLAALEAWRNAR